MAELQDGSPTDYRGVLYNWENDSYFTYYREPANLTYNTTISNEDVEYDSQEAFTYYGGGTWTETMYQAEFNNMVQSVAKYKGFYCRKI